MSEAAVSLSEPPVNPEPAPEAVATPESTPAVAPATPEPSWRDSLSADLRDNPTLASIKDVESLAKDHVNVQKLIGADKIARPQEDWTPEQHEEFWTKLGRPMAAEDYDLSGFTPPEGVPWDDGLQTTMVEGMHKLGLNNDQVAGVLGLYGETTGAQYTEATGDATRTRESGIQDLRNEWGKSFNAQVDLAKRAFMAGAGEGFEALAGLPMADGGQLGDHPAIIKAFAQLGGKMSEHGLVGATASPRSTLSPSEAGNQIAKLLSDEDFLKSYTNAEHLEHSASVKRINDLTEMQVSTVE